MPKGPRVKLFTRIFLKFIYSSVDISNAVAGWQRSCALTVIFCGFLSLGYLVYLISTLLRLVLLHSLIMAPVIPLNWLLRNVL